MLLEGGELRLDGGGRLAGALGEGLGDACGPAR